LAQSRASIAIWGGTGKAAAFMHRFGVDAKRFLWWWIQIRTKWVLLFRTGQKILFRDVLKTTSVDVLIIPAQWRAKDIVAEIETGGD